MCIYNFNVAFRISINPYFFLSFLGILSIYKFVSSIIFSNILSHLMLIYMDQLYCIFVSFSIDFRTNVLNCF